jgi:hypothetical protein
MRWVPLLLLSVFSRCVSIDLSIPFFNTPNNIPQEIRLNPDNVTVSNVSGLSQVHVNFYVNHNVLYDKTCEFLRLLVDNGIIPARNKINSARSTLVATASEHKLPFALAGVTASYILFLARLIYLQHYLINCERWSCWKQEFIIEAADTATQKGLAKELVLAIQQRYHKPEKITDFLAPLVSFFNEIEQEKKLLNQFSRLRKSADYFLLTIILPNQQELLRQVNQRMQRLDFLKQLLIQWITEYKIAINN